MALHAAGLDCTEITEDDETVDLIEQLCKMIESDTSSAKSVYSAVWILPVYDYGYDMDDAGLTSDDLIDAILSAQDDESSLFGADGYEDTQTTAQAIMAMKLFEDDNDSVEPAVTKAKAALKDAQQDDGRFACIPSNTSSVLGDVDTTAEVVAALAACGLDTEAGAYTTSNGSTPLGYLVAQADTSLDGYDTFGSSNEAMTSSTVLMALAAEQAVADADEAVNVYDLKSATTATTGGTSSSAGTTTTTASPSSKGSASAKTDDPFEANAVFVVLAASGACALYARRRVRSLED